MRFCLPGFALLACLTASPAMALPPPTVAWTGTNSSIGANISAGILNIGHEFTVTGSGITVYSLGVFDYNNLALTSSHAVTLFSISSIGVPATETAELASVVVPSGTGGSLLNEFRFVTLATQIYLAPGDYAVVAYGLDVGPTDADPYGESGTQPSNSTNIQSTHDMVFQFTSNASPAFPNGGDANNNLASASLQFFEGNTLASSVPEPGSAILLAGFVSGLASFARRKASRRSAR